jgi:hypothetical protein
MKSFNVQQIINDPQYFCAKEGQKVEGAAYQVFLRSLIREHAKATTDGYLLYARDLPLYDKKIFLSYMIDAEEYEDATSSPYLTAALIEEFINDMQTGINNVIDDVWHEDMQEMGLVLCHHRDNGELYYRSR